ncbi:MAG: hypothetical protein AAFZ15_08320 [Bacteroidota bacterium]
MSAEEKFNAIVKNMESKHEDVHLGKMMSSPGLKVNNKVFAFYHKETMGFRLGKKFDAPNFGLKTARWLSPFKTKPPLKAWYIIDFAEVEFWEELTEMALDFTRQLK